MKIFSLKVFFILMLLVFLFPKDIMAQENVTSCSNRYVTLVNPVRGKALWIDKTINTLKNQYELAKQYNVPATWLLQFDVLGDKDLLGEIGKFNAVQELGVFLEVSPLLAEQARVIYPHSVTWYSPKAVFLSGYSQSDRRRLIDKLFTQFKLKFGFYPKSVGAWWIDSFSLNYLKEKYDIKAAMIVADQKTTDNYGVWGQWWGVPYYPAKANVLVPASSLDNKLNVVVTQWAQRDPLLSVGDGPKYSNYSLQANDYIRQRKDTSYFDQLSKIYLDCQNPVGQITVGLETGIESVGYLNEYKNQLGSLQKNKSLRFVTMSEFADRFGAAFADFPIKSTITKQDSVWNMTSQERFNAKLGEKIIYNQMIAFPDFFIKDESKFLDRRLPFQNEQKSVNWFPWFLIVSLGLLVFAISKKIIKVWLISVLFAVVAFGLIFRSYYQMGWKVYLGPQLPYLDIFQIALILVSFGLIWLVNKSSITRKGLLNLWLLPFTFGMDFIVQAIRVSSISGRYYLGFAPDALRFIGVSIKPFTGINFINQDFPSYISAAFLRVNFENLWSNSVKALLLYPLLHIFLAVIFSLILVRLPRKIQTVALVVLLLLFLLQVNNIFSADPRQVSPILLQ